MPVHQLPPMDTLRRFAVTENGFLPATAPLTCLPDPYYAPWERLVADLPALLRRDALRAAVRSLPILATDRLETEEAWRRAYVVLVFLAHGYVWGGPPPTAEVLPASLARPLAAVAACLELPPVATYAALNLWNFCVAGGGSGAFDEVDCLQALHTFTGTEDESWFFVVSVAMECRAARLLPVLLGALDTLDNALDTTDDDHAAAATAAYRTATAALHQFVACVADLGRLLDRLHERCDPDVFFFQIRPFLAGSKNMAAAGLPRGLFYEGVPEAAGGPDDTGGSWMQLHGGSNGQSSLIQFFDVVLGVEHRSDGGAAAPSPPTTTAAPLFFDEIRAYMPGPHRRFLEHVAARGSLRARLAALAAASSSDNDQAALQAAFREATAALAAFRGKHLAIVTRYILLPSRRQKKQQDETNATVDAAPPSPSPSLSASSELTGTGGTALLPFLKQTRDETLQAGVL